MIKAKVSIFIVTAMLIVGASGLPAYAEYNDSDERNMTTEQKSDRTIAIKERIRGRLDENRKRVCELRSDKIKGIMSRAANQGQRHMQVFTKIYERVVTFYNNKNLEVENYDQLVADVNSKKSAADQAIEFLKANTDFDCNSDDPIGRVEEFRAKLKAMHQALKGYRTSIKNLIVAVKTSINEEARS